MKNFGHVNAATLDEAVSALRRYGKRAAIIAGGTDLLGKMKDEVLSTYPEALVNIKTIPVSTLSRMTAARSPSGPSPGLRTSPRTTP